MSLYKMKKRAGNDEESYTAKKLKPEPKKVSDQCDHNTQDGFQEKLIIDLTGGEKDEKPCYWTGCHDDRHIAGECPTKEGDLCRIHIGNNLYLVVTLFNGERKIHVRVFETPSGLPMYPTKKGVTLDLTKWKRLTQSFSVIDEAITKYKDGADIHVLRHLGSNFRLTLDSGFPVVHIRHWYTQPGGTELRPSTFKGIHNRTMIVS